MKTANMLDSANNKLQELMQILYLLSRDPAVPKDARYHVTVAQGEIALLARVIRNNTDMRRAVGGDGELPLPRIQSTASTGRRRIVVLITFGGGYSTGTHISPVEDGGRQHPEQRRFQNRNDRAAIQFTAQSE